MGEEEVRIPIKVEVDTNDLNELKDEVNKTFKEIHDYESKRSTKKDPWNVKNVAEYESEINGLIAKIGRLQREFAIADKSTPFSELKNTQSAIGDYLRSNKENTKELASAVGSYRRQLQLAEKAEQRIKELKREQTELQKNYNKSVKSIDTSKKGSKSELKNLEKQYQLERQNLSDQINVEKTKSNLARGAAKTAENEANSARARIKIGNEQIANLRVQASELGKLAKQEGYVETFEKNRIKTLQRINDELREASDLIRDYESNAQRATKKDIRDTGYQTPREKAKSKVQKQQAQEEAKAARDAMKLDRERVQAYNQEARTRAAIHKENVRRIKEEEKAKAQEIKTAISGYKKEISALRQSASQYYYKLRAVKMLGFAMNNISTTINKFAKGTLKATGRMLSAYLRVIPGVNALRKALDKTHSSQKKLNNEMKNSGKNSKGLITSAKSLLGFLLKYTLGIRSIYVLFNKLRSAVSSGLESMAQQFDHVNSKMSSIVSSLNYMKASITSVVQPLLSVLAPALEKISALFSEVTFKIASFIAALTGQSVVLKAIRVETDYAASLDKTAKSAKEATKELGKYDKLNVIHKDTDRGSGNDFGGMGWEEVPIDETFADWAKKFKDFLDRLFAPIKAAWEKWKTFVTNAWKYALRELLELAKSVARDFWRVWEEAKTQEIFENIFRIFGDIGLIIGNLARNLKEAWDINENGYRILAAIRDIIAIIVEKIREAADYTVMWSDNLSFIPLFDALADNLTQKVVPAIEKVMELLKIIYEQMLLKIVKDFIEKGLPQIINIAGNIATVIGNIAEKIRIALQSGSNGIVLVDRIEQLLQIVADGIEYCSEKTVEWSEQLDFRPLMTSLIGFLENIKPMVQFLVDTFSAFWVDVLLPFWKYLTEQGAPEFLDKFGESINNIDWEHLTEVMHNFMDALEPFFELAWEVITQVILDITNALVDLINSGTLDIIVEKFRNWVDNADPEEIAHGIETLAKVIVEAVAAFNLITKVILPLITNFMTFSNFFKQGAMMKGITDLTTKITTLTGETTVATGGFGTFISTLSGLAVPILIVVGVIATMVGAFGGVDELLKAIGDRIKEVGDFIKRFAEEIKLGDAIDRLKESFGGLKDGLTDLRPLFEFIFDVIAGVAEVIASVLMPVIKGVIDIVAGVINVITGAIEVVTSFIDIIINLFKGDYAAADEGLASLIEGLGDLFTGLGEIVLGVFEGISEALVGLFEVALPGVVEPLQKWIDDVVGFFSKLKYKLIGDPIVYDMRDGIIEGFNDFISDTFKNVKDWVGDIKDKFVEMKDKAVEKITTFKEGAVSKFNELKEGATEKVITFKDAVVSKFVELKDGMTGESKTATEDTSTQFTNMVTTIDDTINLQTLVKSGTDFIKGFMDSIKKQWTILTTLITTYIKNLLDAYNKNFNITTLVQNGIKFITGLMNGITQMWSTMLTSIIDKIKHLINIFNTNLSPSALWDIGVNLINGLKEGLLSGLHSALDTVRSVCSDIVNTVRDAFQVHSPSEIFKKIGQFLMQGLEIGVVNETEEITKAFADIIPTDATDDFENSFISNLMDMKSSAIDIISSMSTEIEDIINNISFMDFTSQLNKLGTIKIPSIALGYSLPSNADFKNNSKQEIDFSKLPDIIKEAFISAMNEADTDSNNKPIVLQLNSRTVAECVWDEDEKRYKQRGTFTPMYS